ncbi:MAG: DsbA family protein [Proteobacteria bacterium]|nr:DsbA family protein [Pseudomonadota bacterium]
MKGLAIAAITLGLALAGCEANTSNVTNKLDEIAKRLDSIDKKLDQVQRGAARGQARRPARARPSADKVYSVPIEGAPSVGPEHAKVTIVKGFEFACPYCDRVRPTLDQLRKDYGDDVKIVYKHLLVHPQVATTPAYAACAAHKQGKYKEMEKLIWEKGFRAGRNLSRDNMEKLATELGLDQDRFKTDMDGSCKAVVQKDQSELRRVGAGGTPAFFINGRFLSGAQPIHNFKKLIDEELKKANKAIAGGATVNDYYAKQVVAKGLKKVQ